LLAEITLKYQVPHGDTRKKKPEAIHPTEGGTRRSVHEISVMNGPGRGRKVIKKKEMIKTNLCKERRKMKGRRRAKEMESDPCLQGRGWKARE